MSVLSQMVHRVEEAQVVIEGPAEEALLRGDDEDTPAGDALQFQKGLGRRGHMLDDMRQEDDVHGFAG